MCKLKKGKKGESLNQPPTPMHSVFRSSKLDTVAGLASRIFLCNAIIQIIQGRSKTRHVHALTCSLHHEIPRDAGKRNPANLVDDVLVDGPGVDELHHVGRVSEVGGELVLEPRMLPNLRNCDPLHWVDLEHARD